MAIPVLCKICKKAVILETARIDEHGNAVHEDCYVNALRAAHVALPEEPSEHNS